MEGLEWGQRQERGWGQGWGWDGIGMEIGMGVGQGQDGDGMGIGQEWGLKRGWGWLPPWDVQWKTKKAAPCCLPICQGPTSQGTQWEGGWGEAAPRIPFPCFYRGPERGISSVLVSVGLVGTHRLRVRAAGSSGSALQIVCKEGRKGLSGQRAGGERGTPAGSALPALLRGRNQQGRNPHAARDVGLPELLLLQPLQPQKAPCCCWAR